MSEKKEYPSLVKAREAKKNKKLEKKPVIVLPVLSDDSGDSSTDDEKIDVVEYLNELVNKQLKIAYKEVIKPKIKKQINKKRVTDFIPSAPPPSSLIAIPAPAVKKSLFD